MHTRLALIIALLTLSITGWRSINACLWDYDTLRHEARGMPGVIEAITGRFDRYPPLYYEMRLERVTKLLEESPDDLDAYDGAAVACDRLGRSDDAVEWMVRKAEALDRLEGAGQDVSDHRYRYLANLGTFHAHRWVRGGADRSDLADLQRARDLIAAAIELNPDAHFGRERYQLLTIEWLLDPPDPEEVYFHETTDVPSIWMAAFGGDILGGWINSESALVTAGYDDAIDGVTGLIVLGDAWQSVDVFNALACALLDQGDHNVAYVAALRCTELEAEGRRSLHPGAASGSAVVTVETVLKPDEIDAWYARARREADDWREARTEYIMARLNRGEHPDTHPDFWESWSEPSSPPRMPDNLFGLSYDEMQTVRTVVFVPAVLFVILALPAVAFYVMSRVRRRKRLEAVA